MSSVRWPNLNFVVVFGSLCPVLPWNFRAEEGLAWICLREGRG